MCIFNRPSSKWELGGDTIHEDEIFQNEAERTMSLPRLKNKSEVDISRWASSDQLKALCKGIDLNETMDDEVFVSTKEKPDTRESQRPKPWLKICKSILSGKGKITVKDLINVCEKEKVHFTSQQDQDFVGYETAEDMFDCMGISVHKVELS